MAKMTIAQLREKAAWELAKRAVENPSEEDFIKAKRLMNSFYRLCGIDERLLYLVNDEKTANRKSTVALEERREKWFDRINTIFKRDYDACLVYFGYLPTICENGTTQDLYLRYFYE